jgi:antitoxin component YwqK of YwqJK toxin-antitoxin module
MVRVNFDLLDYEPIHALVLYDEQPFTGIAFEYHKDGWLWTEQYCIDGYFHGLCLTYFSNKKVRVESYKLFSTAHGTEREWSKEGNLLRETFSLLGNRINEKKWTNEGVLIEEYKISDDNFSLKLLAKEGIEIPKF